MNKETLDGAEQIYFFSQNLNIGIGLLRGTGFRPGITQLLGEIRAVFPQSKITAFTYSRYWEELGLFEDFDDTAAVTDDNPDGLAKIIRDCELDLVFEINPAEVPRTSQSNVALDIWADGLKQTRVLTSTSGILVNIYVKNNSIVPALEAALTVLQDAPVRGGGALHAEILREIELAAPLNTIAVSPWLHGAKREKAARILEHWILIAHLLIKAGFEILIPGTVEDYSAAVAFKDAIGMPGVRLSAGRATLRQTAILLGRTRGAICAPGAMANLAALAGTPLVVLNEGMSSTGVAPDAAATVESLISMLASRKIGA